MNHKEESINFVKCAYDLLDKYKKQTTHKDGYVGYYLGCDLSNGYSLKITTKGRLALCKLTHKSDNVKYMKVITHTYNNRYSQEAYVGILLNVYIRKLEEELNAENN